MPNPDSMVENLPRLAIITDVPVERTQSGQLLLFRLLKQYPIEKLLIVGSNQYPSAGKDYRLPEVNYKTISYGFPRLYSSKYNPLGPWLKTRAIKNVHVAVEKSIAEFDPQAILTVTHSYLWLEAAELAARRRLPLHLILHDDWPSMITSNRESLPWQFIRRLVGKRFGPIYRQAVSRLCVSPGMAELYEQRYGSPGHVLYPNRGDDSPLVEVRVGRSSSLNGPVVAFAGALHTGVNDSLRVLAKILADLGGHLDFYTRTSAEVLYREDLRPPVVRRIGFFPPQEMADRVAATAHMLFLPATFRPNERTDTSTLFPSKLADYTAIGLPILIWGPEYSSAVRWGKNNPTTGVTIDRLDDSIRVKDAIIRFWQDKEFAFTCAKAACEAGTRDFEANSASHRLYTFLSAASQVRVN